MSAMRPIRLTARLSISTALGAVLATAVLTAPGIARAGDDDRPFEERIIHNVLTGLGLKDPNAPGISYQERPPLVIPPDDSLPPPQKAGTAIANNPAWPKDPDVMRAKALAKRSKNRDVEAEMLRDNNPLPPDQLGPQGGGRRRTAASGAPTNEDPRATGYGYSLMNPSQLGYTGGLFSNMFGSKDDQQTAQFTGEPARTSLTDPPPGYQTPSPGQPYGLGKEAAAPKASNNFVKRGEVDNGVH